jgi:hypothetical protein
MVLKVRILIAAGCAARSVKVSMVNHEGSEYQ